MRHVNRIILAVVVLMALAGLLPLQLDPAAIDLDQRLAAPGAEFWLGADQFGRDVFSRLLSAAPRTLFIAAASVTGAMLAGVPLGLIAGYFGGWIDRAIGVLIDAVLALPSMLVAIAVLAVLGQSDHGVVLALAIAYSAPVARVARAATISLCERDFVSASRLLGRNSAFTLFRHVLPNAVAPLTVIAGSLFAASILAESALTFLGLGVPPPAPTWGGMLYESRPFAGHALWLAIPPGLAITLTVLAANLTADRIRDRLDPRLRASL